MTLGIRYHTIRRLDIRTNVDRISINLYLEEIISQFNDFVVTLFSKQSSEVSASRHIGDLLPGMVMACTRTAGIEGAVWSFKYRFINWCLTVRRKGTAEDSFN